MASTSVLLLANGTDRLLLANGTDYLLLGAETYTQVVTYALSAQVTYRRSTSTSHSLDNRETYK